MMMLQLKPLRSVCIKNSQNGKAISCILMLSECEDWFASEPSVALHPSLFEVLEIEVASFAQLIC
eukprot:768431-Hanusia_phi.AAC.15